MSHDDLLQRITSACEPDRLLGSLLGMAVGDALGTTLEFLELEAPVFPTMARGPHRQITGGGPFGVAPGQVTDDTQLAVCLARSLVEKGSLDVEDLGRRYVEWQTVCFDIGNQTWASLQHIQASGAARDAGRPYWEERGRKPAGNGSLMRTAPIGVLLAAADAERRHASLMDSAITHFDLRCQLACAAFNSAIARAVESRPCAPRDLVEAARAELDESAALAKNLYPDLLGPIDDARSDLARDLDAACSDDPQVYGPEIHIHAHQGFVRVAFRLAFWQLVHAESFEAGLVDVVNRGGDADTNGAITGALLGAYHGVGAIPRAWLETVLGVFQGEEDNAWWTTYHPRLLVQALEAVYQRPLWP